VVEQRLYILIVHCYDSVRIPSVFPSVTMFANMIRCLSFLILHFIFRHLGAPKSMDYSKVKSMLKDVPGVMMIHNLHIWSLNVDKHCLTAHLAVGENICVFLSFMNLVIRVSF
jgi:hypothetical protein